MKLSEAIRRGCKLKPQAFGMMYDGRGTCALGAAIEGSGAYTFKHGDYKYELFSIYELVCKKVDLPDKIYQSKIMELNDQLKWTREAIADWVEENYEGKNSCGQKEHDPMPATPEPEKVDTEEKRELCPAGR